MHLGIAAKNLGIYVATPVFDGANREEIIDALKEAGLDEDGKAVLYDGRTGEPFLLQYFHVYPTFFESDGTDSSSIKFESE